MKYQKSNQSIKNTDFTVDFLSWGYIAKAYLNNELKFIFCSPNLFVTVATVASYVYVNTTKICSKKSCLCIKGMNVRGGTC